MLEQPGATPRGVALEARGLARHFGAHRALDGLDLRIEPGEAFGLLGANGAGKTTFLRLVTGYLLPTAGSVTVDGISPARDAQAVARRLGFVAETTRLYPELRVRGFLRFVAGARGLAGALADSRVAEGLRRFDLEAVAHRPIGHLSKGFQQRVNLAQGFLHDPPLLLVDEPTSGLDPLQQAEVRGVLRALRGERTLLLCTHDLGEARELTERVAVLHRGRLVAVGPTAEVLGAGDPLALFRGGGPRGVIPFRALFRKELALLFGAPLAWAALSLVVLVTALIFFDHLRLYNQTLFLYASTTMGGLDTDTIPDYVNLRDTVFFPVMETLGITLIGLVPLVTMRVFAEERARGTDELLLTTELTPTRIVLAKFAAAYLFVVLMMAASFVYPAMAIVQGGLGAQHLAAVFVGLSLHAIALASIGLACSAWTGSQLVAAVAGWALGFVIWDFEWVKSFRFVGETGSRLLDALSLHLHYGSFAEGILDAGHVAYFVSLGAVTLAIARLSFLWRRVAG